MVKMTLKVKVNEPHFQYQPRVFQITCLMQIWWFQPKSVTSYRTEKFNFLEFWVKWPKWPWGSVSMGRIFNSSREYPNMSPRVKTDIKHWNTLCGLKQIRDTMITYQKIFKSKRLLPLTTTRGATYRHYSHHSHSVHKRDSGKTDGTFTP